MPHYDVFNGDADGLCALQQLRLDDPRAAVPVTGVKRDIELLRRVPALAGDTVTVLDISLERNREPLLVLLRAGVAIEYFDHHFAGAVPTHPLLAVHLDAAPDVCTSVLVDRHLQGRHRAWAVVGAFGDGLPATADALAATLGLSAAQRATLRTLGEAINYNAYGEAEADLLVAPVRLAQEMRPHADPIAFAAESEAARTLACRQQEDMALARAQRPAHASNAATVFVLPNAPWARRVQGVFAHALGEGAPTRAHAVLCERPDGTLSVSVRAPRQRPLGAETLCRTFATGGGRPGAAGIDALPPSDLPRFLQALDEAFGDLG